MSDQDLLHHLRLAYDRSAARREASNVQQWKAEERDRFLAMLRAEDKHRLIEIGAGTGVHGKWFQDQGLDVVCTDLSPGLVQLCRDKGLDAHVMDFLHLDFPPASFDAMFGMNCLLHVPRADLQRNLAALRRVLKPGALFYWGQYGGIEFEGVWPDDTYEPKRFFSYMTDEQIELEATQLFEMVDFRFISINAQGDLGYQALVLRAQPALTGVLSPHHPRGALEATPRR
ncbi:MAG TPA: class I SAM-dependent methyltransferase [Dehalococcoidia bacterium]|nr:class I SAM-dependent methyltransferase [Dehalococcoidia bacterium]